MQGWSQQKEWKNEQWEKDGWQRAGMFSLQNFPTLKKDEKDAGEKRGRKEVRGRGREIDGNPERGTASPFGDQEMAPRWPEAARNKFEQLRDDQDEDEDEGDVEPPPGLEDRKDRTARPDFGSDAGRNKAAERLKKAERERRERGRWLKSFYEQCLSLIHISEPTRPY